MPVDLYTAAVIGISLWSALLLGVAFIYIVMIKVWVGCVV